MNNARIMWAILVGPREILIVRFTVAGLWAKIRGGKGCEYCLGSLLLSLFNSHLNSPMLRFFYLRWR